MKCGWFEIFKILYTLNYSGFYLFVTTAMLLQYQNCISISFCQVKLILRCVLSTKNLVAIFSCQSLLFSTSVPNDTSSYYQQQQPTASYRQTSKSLANRHKPATKVKITYMCDNPSMLISMPTILCMSNGLTCGCIADIHLCMQTKDVSCHMSCKVCCNSSEFYEYYLVYFMPITLQICMPLIIHNLHCITTCFHWVASYITTCLVLYYVAIIILFLSSLSSLCCSYIFSV